VSDTISEKECLAQGRRKGETERWNKKAESAVAAKFMSHCTVHQSLWTASLQ